MVALNTLHTLLTRTVQQQRVEWNDAQELAAMRSLLGAVERNNEFQNDQNLESNHHHLQSRAWHAILVELNRGNGTSHFFACGGAATICKTLPAFIGQRSQIPSGLFRDKEKRLRLQTAAMAVFRVVCTDNEWR